MKTAEMKTANKSQPIGMIGLGLLGSAIAARLRECGWQVIGFDPEEAARADLLHIGGQVADSVEIVAQASRRIVLCLPDADVSRKVLSEILPVCQTGTIVMDTTTGAPDVMAANAELAAKRGVGYLDACVSGSSVLMREGRAVLMVGGSAADFSHCETILRDLGKEVFPLPKPGDGARMKLVTNLVLGLNRAVLAEGLFFAQNQGLDLELTLDVLRSGPANSEVVAAKGAKMVAGDFTPQAKLSQHRKDVDLILNAVESSPQRLPLSDLHVKMLRLCEDRGWGSLDNSAIIRGYFSRIFDSDFRRE